MNTEEKLIKIILVRHGLKSRTKPKNDQEIPLSPAGRHQIELLGENLANRKLTPIVFFTSPYTHSKETAEILKKQLGGEIVSLEKLKPENREITFDDLITEIKEKKEIEVLEVMTFVGHYPSLGKLQQLLTKDRISRVIQRGEAVCFTGKFQDFKNSDGELEFRIADNVDRVIEEQLHSKIQSKMTVSTFLAGFTFAVLNDLLKTKSFNMPQTIAAISMTGSLLLFVASVYMYDNMTMPKEYWSKQSNRETHFTTDHDLLHHYMIRTWNWVFTPAVALALIGFIATLFNTGNDLMIVVVVVIILGVILYYFKMKPVLGQD